MSISFPSSKMKFVAVSLLAARAAMAQVTLPPNLNQAVNIAADLDACETAATRLLNCADEAGGLDGLLNAAPDEVLSCACCSSRAPVSRAYLSCSDYLSEEFPMATTDYEGKLSLL